mgnify:CR=1 FL=1
MSTIESHVAERDIKNLCDKIRKYNYIDPADFERFNVKRGLRNSDGTGVLAGVTNIGSVQGYMMLDGDPIPMPGKLYYRGLDISDIIQSHVKRNIFGFEEVCYLLEECYESVGNYFVIVDDVAGVLVEKVTERNFELTEEVKVTCLEELVKE